MRGGARLLMVCALLGAVAVRAGDDPLLRARTLLSGLSGDAPTARYAETARDFGRIVDELREERVPDAALAALRTIAVEMRERTQDRLRIAETALGEDEGALEELYRSRVWDDLSFALAAFPFWGAWLDLELAERPAQSENRVRLLWQARRGFRAASMQIYQPNLVFGGWLGLGYLARAEGQNARARQIFESLLQALSADREHPVRKLAEDGLARLDGSGPTAGAQPEPPATPEARRAEVRAEIVALLAQQRRQKVGAREAGARLRAVIDAGEMDMPLLAALQRYRAEIVSEDLREYTELLAAEFAYGNEQWFSAAQRYRAFFGQRARGRDLNFDRFRYRYAVAALRADLTSETAQIAERLLAAKNLEPELRTAATKLAYVARARRSASHSTADAREALERAARRFVAASPSDPDADGARVLLAQSSADPDGALRLLAGVKSTSRFQGDAESTRYYLLARQFTRLARGGELAALESLARQGLSAWDGLPRERKSAPENQILYLQFRAVADPDPSAVLKEIARLQQKPAASVASERAYLWAKLRCWERLGEPERVREEIVGLGDRSAPSWMAEELYPWLTARKDLDLQAAVAALLAPKLRALPEMERRFRLLEIEALLARDRSAQAYAAARALVTDYPRAGDGYRMLGKSAAATGRYVEADAAWAVITDKVPPSRAVWWEGMLSRVEIRTASTRPEAACELAARIAREAQAPTADLAARWHSLKERLSCPSDAAPAAAGS